MGADPNYLTSDDTSAIHLAAGVETRSEEFTRPLLQYGADPNVACVKHYMYGNRLKIV